MLGKVFLNTSVIQYLYPMGLIHILNALFEEVYVPLEVKEEIERGKAQGVELPHLDEIDFIKVVGTETSSLIGIVRDLGKGKAAVILLGTGNPGSLVILDDRLAREVARALKVKVTGTAGLLIMAKERGLIKAVKPCLDKLIDTGFYLAPEHKALILKEANEA